MTRTIRYATLTAVLAATALIPAPNAFGRPSPSPATGTIVSVDRDARAIVVRDRETRQTVRIEIPRDSQVAIAEMKSKGSAVDFEQVLVGMTYRGTRKR
jgi:hypothetical protein